MPPTPHLDAAAVKRWLEGQRAAEMMIEQERVRFLQELTPERALSIYLGFPHLSASREGPSVPSPLLWAMRQALSR